MLTRGIDLSEFSPVGATTHLLSTDLFDEPRGSTPPVPPGLEDLAGLGQGVGQSGLDDESELPRRSTPTIPPGFTAPVTAPIKDESAASLPPSRSTSRASLRRGNSQILPAVPVLPGTPVRAPTPLRHETKSLANSRDDMETPTKRGRSESHMANVNIAANDDSVSGAEAEIQTKAETKQETKAESRKAKRKEKLEKEKAEKAEKAAASIATSSTPVATPEEPAAKSVSPQKAAVPQPAPPGASKDEKNKAATKTADLVKDLKPSEAVVSAKSEVGNTTNKKKHPGKLDITAAVLKGPDPVVPSTTSTPVKTEPSGPLSRGAFNAVAISRPQSPSVSSDAGVKKTTAPRTLRVVSTPKVEAPPPAPVVAPAVPPVPPGFQRIPSRQPSVASFQAPGTPSSEHISDNVSMTSTSLSRANSPPPPSQRVGSAPVRHNTKSQQKKARQERAKQIEEEERLAKEETETKSEPVQEAITSRKKKSKKASTPAASSTPVASRPVSPKPKAKVEEPIKELIKEPEPATPVKEPTPVLPPTPSPPPPAAAAPPLPPPPPPAMTPSSLVSEIRNNPGPLAGALDAFFRPIAQVMMHYKPSQQITPVDVSPNKIPARMPELKKEDLEALLSGQPWRSSPEDQQRIWDRLMVTPGGALLRHLEPAFEDRFLAVEALHRALPEALRFHASTDAKFASELDCTNINLAALRREMEGLPNTRGTRSANAMEKAVEEGSKKGSFLVDTAGKYVNEFIMPPVPLSPPNEKIVKEEQKQGFTAEELDRKLSEARRVAEDREAGLRRLVKKNRKIVGMTH